MTQRHSHDHRPRSALWSLAMAALLALAGCEAGAPAEQKPAVATQGKWTVARAEGQGALASVWGSGPSDVWAAGGRSGHGLILHSDGKTWSEVPTAIPGFVWWIYGSGAHDVYAVGEAGLIWHYDGATWSSVPSGTTRTLYGLWAAGPDDVWAVGGNPEGLPGDAVLLRGNAQGFKPVAVPSSLLPSALFKIYGSPAGGVVAVGVGGTILHFDGTWHRDQVPTESALVSLWSGGGLQLYAVGGDATGVLLHYDGASWHNVAGVQAGLQLFGVFKAPGQPVYAVGAGPRIVEMDADSSPREAELPDLGPATVLHSVWGDGQGKVYAAGGTLYGGQPTMTGVLLQRH